MYRHILIPTDGSKLAAKGIRAGVRLAKALGARVTGVCVVPPYMPPMYDEGTVYFPGPAKAAQRKAAQLRARKALAVVEIEAQAAKVPCATRIAVSDQPWRAILAAARSGNCDTIVMASHGRGGLGGLILGSETTRVLASSKIPVLVIR